MGRLVSSPVRSALLHTGRGLPSGWRYSSSMCCSQRPDSDYGVNVTITERVLSRIDSSAARRGESRLGLMTQAALEFMAEGEP